MLVAEPGAGKTTRVPPALLNGLGPEEEIVVLEPRRLAASLAARRVASELEIPLGGLVGYQVRFDNRTSGDTRLRYVTEGVLIRQLVSDPTLKRASIVVLDEFHERRLHSDLAVAWLHKLQESERPDLRLVVMSATLDAEPVANFLSCPTVHVPGRQHEVVVEHATRVSTSRLEERVAGAVRRLVREDLQGHILVFLPGAAEIRRALEACRPVARTADLALEVLHGSQPLEAQLRALAPSSRRKVILSTNVAETSVTVPGVEAVIDSGLARMAGHSPWSGLSTLETGRISKAAATQRAGRAGRTGPGRCLRLYPLSDFEQRPAHETAEILRSDLSELLLLVRSADSSDDDSYPFFEAPKQASIDAAKELLHRLDALDADGNITTTGQALLRLPLHPRLGRLVVEAARRGVGERGCLLAALLGERDIRLTARRSEPADTIGQSDPLEQLEAFEAVARLGLQRSRVRAHGLDPNAVTHVRRTQKQLASRLEGSLFEGRGTPPRSDEEADEALLHCILAAFPDRVGRRRRPRGRTIVFASGGSGRLAPSSVVGESEFVVAVTAERQHGRVILFQVSAIEPDWLIDLFPDSIVEHREVGFDDALQRVWSVEKMMYEGLILDESRSMNGRGTEVTNVLATAAIAAGPGAFCDVDELQRFRERVSFAADFIEELEAIDEEKLRALLASLCEGKNSFAELRQAPLLPALRGALEPAALARLGRVAPEHVAIPGRRRVPVSYPADRPPFIASRLQDFFGLADSPRIAEGKVPLVLHLLAPNMRAVQVTTDLAGFWERHYPAIRRQLRRRYPKHAWPEKP